MKRTFIVILLVVILGLSLIREEKPVFVCGGGTCTTAFQEFVKLTPNYLILTAYEDLCTDTLPGKFKIIVVKTKEEANSKDLIRQIMSCAGLFISGGDQYIYHTMWANTKLSRAIASLIGRIPILTTSASSMILGEKYYTAEHGFYRGGDKSLITIGQHFIDFCPFKHTVIDTHYTERDRQLRLKEFCEITGFRGIGIDESCYIKAIGNNIIECNKGGVHYVSQDDVN